MDATGTREDRSWRLLYVIGGVAAFAALALLVLDIVVAMLPGWGTDTVPATALGWFDQFAANPVLGIRNLDFLNIVSSLVVLPTYLAIYGALRRTEPALALLGLILVSLGTALFVAANAALPMLELSRQYGLASNPAEQATLASAAQALLARGAHGSYGSYPGFLLSEVGTLVTGLALLRSEVFGRVTAWVGILGILVLAIYTTAYTFGPAESSLVMLVAMPGGLLMIAWNVLVGRRLLRTSSAAGAARSPIR